MLQDSWTNENHCKVVKLGFTVNGIILFLYAGRIAGLEEANIVKIIYFSIKSV